jgi:hypothetical protein
MTFDEFIEARDPHIELYYKPEEWHILAEMLNTKGVSHYCGSKADPVWAPAIYASHIHMTERGRFMYNDARQPVTIILFSELNDTTIPFDESDFLSLIE